MRLPILLPFEQYWIGCVENLLRVDQIAFALSNDPWPITSSSHVFKNSIFRIYDFFFMKLFLLSSFELQSAFFLLYFNIKSHISTFFQYIVWSQLKHSSSWKSKQIKFRWFIDTEFVKTCDELLLIQDLLEQLPKRLRQY